MSPAANAKSAADATAWHAMGMEDVAERLTANVKKGLDAGEAASRLEKFGPNRLPEGKKRGPLMGETDFERVVFGHNAALLPRSSYLLRLGLVRPA